MKKKKHLCVISSHFHIFMTKDFPVVLGGLMNEPVLCEDHTCRGHGCYDVIVSADVDSVDGCLTAQPFPVNFQISKIANCRLIIPLSTFLLRDLKDVRPELK